MTTRKKIMAIILAAGGLAILLYTAFLAGGALSALDRDEIKMKVAFRNFFRYLKASLSTNLIMGNGRPLWLS